jgi:hypothetical protein
MLLYEADPPASKVRADRRNEPARGFDDLDAVDHTRAIRIPEVREDGRRPVRLDEDRRVRALEAREVADVRLPAEDVRGACHEKRLLE